MSSQLVSERLKASQVQEVEGLRGRVDERQRVEDFAKEFEERKRVSKNDWREPLSWIQALLERANLIEKGLR